MSAAAVRGLGRFAPRAAVGRGRTAEADSPVLRLAAFTALAAFAAGHWATLVADAPTLRLTGAVAAAVAVGAALGALRYAELPRPAVWAIAAAISVAGLALALMSMGLPARLLPPGAWDDLANELDRGLAGIRTLDWPYAGPDESVRLAILLGAPLLLTIAAALSFWPARRGEAALRGSGLVVLLLLYGTAVTEHDPGEPLRRGFVLLLLLAAWLWLPRLGRREAIVGAVVVLAVGLGAMPLADRLNRDTALVDYQSWNWFGGKDVVFDWNHSYGPLDWPREGTTLLNVESDRPLYWKAETLETFDGLRWVRTDQNQSTSALGEIPDEADPKWLERVRVTVRSLRTNFVVVAGTPVEVDGAGGSLSPSSDGTIRTLGEPLERGDSYTVNSYSPNPKPRELRAADAPYDLELEPYTRIGLPGARDAVTERPGTQGELLGRSPADSLETPLRGNPGAGSAGARAALESGPYARTYRLAQRLTAGAPTAYAAVRNVEQYLQEGFTYNERPPTQPYPLEAFLFEDKLGYCQQFSGAMALMLRMSGIPARVVSGFSPGSFNRDTGEYRVRDLDAHSWVEVFYPTIGWVTYDPTPTTSPAVTAGQGAEARDRNGSAFSQPGGGSPGAPDRSLEPGGGAGTQGSEALAAGTVALALLVLLLAAAGALVALRVRRSRGLKPVERSEAGLRELERALPRLGWRLAPGSTLLELERRLRSAAGPTAAGYVARLRDGRFSSRAATPPNGGQRRALRRELTAAGGLRTRLRGFLALPPGGPRLRA
ncbi:MAG: transglutaminaseTgpA domain-containing protein [Actinomycetota bacterium]